MTWQVYPSFSKIECQGPSWTRCVCFLQVVVPVSSWWKSLSLFSLLVKCTIRKGSYGGCYATLHPISCHTCNTECSNTTHDCSPVLISFCVTDSWYMDGQFASFHAVTRWICHGVVVSFFLLGASHLGFVICDMLLRLRMWMHASNFPCTCILQGGSVQAPVTIK